MYGNEINGLSPKWENRARVPPDGDGRIRCFRPIIATLSLNFARHERRHGGGAYGRTRALTVTVVVFFFRAEIPSGAEVARSTSPGAPTEGHNQ